MSCLGYFASWTKIVSFSPFAALCVSICWHRLSFSRSISIYRNFAFFCSRSLNNPLIGKHAWCPRRSSKLLRLLARKNSISRFFFASHVPANKAKLKRALGTGKTVWWSEWFSAKENWEKFKYSLDIRNGRGRVNSNQGNQKLFQIKRRWKNTLQNSLGMFKIAFDFEN